MTIAACQTHTDVRIVKAQQKNNRRYRDKKTTKRRAARRRRRQKKKTGGRPKGNTMKNNDTFNQIHNSNLASMDPGYGQFAQAKASSALYKQVINK